LLLRYNQAATIDKTYSHYQPFHLPKMEQISQGIEYKIHRNSLNLKRW
jgi:hypothetical protein